MPLENMKADTSEEPATHTVLLDRGYYRTFFVDIKLIWLVISSMFFQQIEMYVCLSMSKMGALEKW